MKKIFIFTLLISAVFCFAFQVDTFEFYCRRFSCANLDQVPASFGIQIANQEAKLASGKMVSGIVILFYYGFNY